MKLYPVVHIRSEDQAEEQANIAFEAGADGVYLIDHANKAHNTSPLFGVANRIKAAYPERYVGVNILGLGAWYALGTISSAYTHETLLPIDAVWIDDMHRESYRNPGAAMLLKNADNKLRNLSIHGGVAFKYTPTFTDDPEEARRETLALMNTVDVVTTSGEGTGHSPSVAKIAAMKEVLGERPLAVASGITIENIANYLGLVDEVLAATSIETYPSSGIFERERLQDLIQAAHDLAN